MKNLVLFTALWLLVLDSQAQQVSPSVFDPAACGCALDATRFADTAYTNHLPEPFDKLNESFVYNSKRNDVAIGVINSFRASKSQSELTKAVTDAIGQITQKPKEQAWLDALKKDMDAIVMPSTAVSNWKPYTAQIACLFTERMHLYYTKYPEQALPAHKDRYLPAVALVPNPDSMAQTAADGAPAAAPATGGGGMLFWVVAVLAIGGWGYGLLQRRQIGALQDQVLNARKDAQTEMEAERKNIRSQISQMEEKNATLSSENNDLKHKIALAGQEILYLKSKQNPSANDPKTAPVADNNTAIRYLYAPTSDGVFYRNNIREHADGDTIYQLLLKDPAAQEAEFSILLNEDVIRRADSMAQQLLIPACDLMGKGKMPTLLSPANIRQGRLRREGEGWRIVEKIKISW